MKHLRLRLALVLLPLMTVHCSMNAFKVVSTPVQADVFVENPKSGEKKNLGKTPLEMPMDQMKEQIGGDALEGDFVTILVEKEGFLSQRLAIPSAHFGTMVTSIDAKLKEGDDLKQKKLADEILDRFFLAQRLAVGKEYQRAQAEVDKILVLAPNFPRAFSMRASIYYVQNNLVEALKWYEEALKQDPQMDEAVKMIAKINGGKGARLPASAAPGAKR